MTSLTGTRERAPDWAARLKLLGAVAAAMVIPVVAIRAIDRLDWAPGDAVFLAILIGLIAVALEVAARVPERRAYVGGLGLALATGLAQIWVNLAVGIIGSEDHPINLIYAGVVAVAVLGAALAGLRPSGMARAMTAAATAQAACFLIALAAGFGFTGPITVFFISLWLIAAGLFRRSASSEGKWGA